MNRNTSKIKEGIRRLTSRPHEIISGTVVAGSVDTTSYIMSVQPSDDSEPIEGVLLNTRTEDGNGMILFPEENSDVIIGSIDGPGEWVLLRASKISSVKITIGSVIYEMDNNMVNIQNSNVVLNISDTVFKVNTASESLFQLLKDCFTYITELTVPTPSGTSSIPVNVADFNNLITRLNNLLTS